MEPETQALPRAPTAIAMREAHIVLWLIVVTAAIRVAVASCGGLGFDEAYMAANARIAALSYVDGPPLHVWLAAAVERLSGSENPLLLRLPFIGLFAGSTWLMYRLSASLFTPRAGVWAALAFNCAPVFTLAHASWVLPDGPLIFFVLATAVIVARILFEAPVRHPTAWWVAAGLCGGLACLAKYHGAFLFLGVLAFLLTVPSQRRWLATPGPWLGAAVAVLVFSPVIVWNLQHAGVGVLFQADRLARSPGITLRFLPQNILGQAVYLTPWLFVALLYALVGAWRAGPTKQKPWFLALLASGPILFFTGAALFARGLPHWPMPGWLFVFPLAGALFAAWAERCRKLMYGGAAVAVAVPLAFAVALAVQTETGAVGRAFPGLLKAYDPALDLVDWSALAPALAQRHLIGADAPALAAAHWTDAAKANFAVGRTVPVVCLCDSPQQFAYTQNLPTLVGHDLILVGTALMLRRHGDAMFPRFERVEPLEPVTLRRRNGTPVLDLQLFRGVGFKG